MPGYGPSASSASVRYVSVSEEGNPKMLDKRAIKEVKLIVGGDTQTAEMAFEVTILDAEGTLRFEHRGKRVLWTPDDAGELKPRQVS